MSYFSLLLSKLQWAQKQVQTLEQTSPLATGCCRHTLLHLLHFPILPLPSGHTKLLAVSKETRSCYVNLPATPSLLFFAWPTSTNLSKVLKFYSNYAPPSPSELMLIPVLCCAPNILEIIVTPTPAPALQTGDGWSQTYNKGKLIEMWKKERRPLRAWVKIKEDRPRHGHARHQPTELLQDRKC